MAVTVNGNLFRDCVISMPRTGAWWMNGFLDAAEEITGDVTIDIDGELELKGTIKRQTLYVTNERMRIVGGKGGLAKNATPKHYKDSVPVRNVISDLLSDAGETLSSGSSADVLATDLGNWTTIQQPVSRMIQTLMEYVSADAVFRVLPDGTVFVGVDTFEEQEDKLDLTLLDDIGDEGKLIIGLDFPVLQPGQAVFGRKISYVQHWVDPEKARSIVWWEP